MWTKLELFTLHVLQTSRHSDLLWLGQSAVRVPVWARDFSLLDTRPDRSWGLPSFLYSAYRVSFAVVKRQSVTLITHPHLSPLYPSWYVMGRSLSCVCCKLVCIGELPEDWWKCQSTFLSHGPPLSENSWFFFNISRLCPLTFQYGW